VESRILKYMHQLDNMVRLRTTKRLLRGLHNELREDFANDIRIFWDIYNPMTALSSMDLFDHA